MEGYPTKPIELVVGFTPGGASDRLARAVAPAMSNALGQSLTITNRPGHAGNPAARYVAAADPDGYTLLLGNNSLLAANPVLFPEVGYEPRTDFAPVTLIGLQPSILVVSPSLPATELDELIGLARDRPGELAIAVSGYGSAAHLAAELLKSHARLELREVSYDGAAPALENLAVGNVDMMFATASSVLDHIEAGLVRPLAVTSAQRAALLPDLRTMGELGFAGFEAASWHGIVTPAGTPAPVIQRLHLAAVSALHDPAVRHTLQRLALEVVGASPAEFAAHIENETPKWAAIVTASGAVAPASEGA